MFSMPKTRLINSKISQFYKLKEIEQIKNVSAFFQGCGSFNSIKIVEYLWPNSRSDEVFKDLENHKYEEYLMCYNKLLPIFHYTVNIVNDNKNAFNNFKLQWMGKNVNSYMDMRNSYNNSKTGTFEHALILTSLLANGMTDVYLSETQGKYAPHLLKDLINSVEIIKVFGLEMTILLKIIMGSPNSINLRNIVWHGFPKPEEIPNYYVNVLLISIHSLGCILETRKIRINNRSQITSFNEHIKVIEQNFHLKPLKLAYLQKKLAAVDNDFKLYWEQLLVYYELEKYKEFIILALPQIELLLRLHYGAVNNCDISAKLDEYYITIDTIFKSNVSSRGDEVNEISNKLLHFESINFEGCFHLLYDMFLSPNGCRLRDKVSHGEVYLEALNNSKLCSLVFHVFVVLLYPEECKTFDNYESKLHLNSLAKFNAIKSCEKLNRFYETHLENSQELCPKSLMIHSRISIFQRPKKEAEFMLLISKIAENMYKTIVNYEESIEMRQSLLVQRELHSKRRKTLENLQIALPNIFKTLCLILSSISKIFTLLQKDYLYVLENEHNYNRTLRFLKLCLTISENMLKYSHSESNEWIQSLKLCRKYDEVYKKLYLYDD